MTRIKKRNIKGVGRIDLFNSFDLYYNERGGACWHWFLGYKKKGKECCYTEKGGPKKNGELCM